MSRVGNRRRSSAIAAAAACALGFACGELASRKPGGTLPSAGSARDDGSGLLAAVSMGPRLGSARDKDKDKDKGAAGGNNYAYKSDYRYGAGGYGNTGYGGSIYSNYQFSPSSAQRYVPLPNQYQVGYSIQTVDNGGAIEGVVTWPKSPKAKPVPKVAGQCNEAPPSVSLQVKSGKVAGAVVYLEDIRKGRSHPSDGQSRKMQLGGLVVRDDCAMFPHVQVVAPIGATVTVRSTGAGKRLTRLGYHSKPELGKAEAEHNLETLSRGGEREFRLDAAGFYSAVPPGLDYGAGAWVVVAGHPYYATTDEGGRFQLEDVPPGAYSLVVWHPSVHVGNGKWTKPRVSRRKVTVKAFQTTKASVSL